MSDDQSYVVNVEGAIVNDDKYLVATRAEDEEHAAGMLSLVGGTVETTDMDDTADILKKTVRREIHEETTLEIADEMAYVETGYFVTDSGVPVVNILFLCRYAGGTAVPAESEEVASVQWLTVDEVANHPNVPPWTRQSVEQAEKRRIELDW